MKRNYTTIEATLKAHRLEAKLINEACDFAIKKVTSVLDKPFNARCIDQQTPINPNADKFRAWVENINIDGYDVTISVELRKSNKSYMDGKKVLAVYVHGYNEKINAYTPDVCDYIGEIYKIGGTQDNWDEYLEELKHIKSFYETIPSDAEIEKFLTEFEKIQKYYNEHIGKLKKEHLGVFWGDAIACNPEQWKIRGNY